MDREQLVEAFRKCRKNCRQSKDTGPFSGCRCQGCLGAAHGSEYLGHRTRAQRKNIEQNMRDAVDRGRDMVASRIQIAREIRAFEREVDRAVKHTMRSIRRAS